MEAWSDRGSLGDEEVELLHRAHHERPRDVLGCHRRVVLIEDII